MAEPVYPTLETQEGGPIGFEGLDEPGGKSYNVEFTASDPEEPDPSKTAAGKDTGSAGSEEIRLLERSKGSPPTDEEKVSMRKVSSHRLAGSS